MNLTAGNVYFLKLETESEAPPLPFYKIGITEGTISERIDQLQTGNPFRIVPWHHFRSEAAQLIEGHLHRIYSTCRVRLEWFRFTNRERDAAVGEGERYNREISPIAARVRAYDACPSNGVLREPGPEEREIHAEAIRLLHEIVPRRAELQALECELRTLTGLSGGIDGITQVRLVAGGETFRAERLQNLFPDLYKAFLTVEDIQCSFRFGSSPRINAFPDVRTRLNAARELVPEVDPGSFVPEPVARSDDAAAIHDAYLRLRSELSALEGDLRAAELRLRDRCGPSEGFEGICSYTRSPTRKLDTSALREVHPDAYAACLVPRPAQVRFQVIASRAYE